MPLKIPALPRNPRPAWLVFIKCGLRVGVRGGAKKGGNPHRPAPCTPLLTGHPFGRVTPKAIGVVSATQLPFYYLGVVELPLIAMGVSNHHSFFFYF